MNVIWSLCRKYTDLSDEEIRIIEHMSETLQPLANLEGADIFIDCLFLFKKETTTGNSMF